MPEPNLTDPKGIEDLLLFRMSRVVHVAGSIVRKFCEGKFGVSRREWSILGRIAAQERMTWSELLERAEIDAAHASRVVSSLVNKGLLAKTHSGDRTVHLELTQKGRELYVEIFPMARDINAHLLSVLDAETIAVLDRTLPQLHAQARVMAREVETPKARGRKKASGAGH